MALAQGQSVAQVCRALGVTEQTYYRWRKEYGGMRVAQAKRLKQLEGENARLRRAVADLTVANQTSGKRPEGDLVSPTRARAGKCAPCSLTELFVAHGSPAHPRADNAPRVHQPGRAEMAWPRRSPVRSSPGPAAPGRERLHPRGLQRQAAGRATQAARSSTRPRKPRPRSRAGARTTTSPAPTNPLGYRPPPPGTTIPVPAYPAAPRTNQPQPETTATPQH